MKFMYALVIYSRLYLHVKLMHVKHFMTLLKSAVEIKDSLGEVKTKQDVEI